MLEHHRDLLIKRAIEHLENVVPKLNGEWRCAKEILRGGGDKPKQGETR
jgi:hypothetical protein